MSLDYTCYTARHQRPTCGSIQSSIGRWQVTFTNPDTRRVISPRLRIPLYCYVWGWRLLSESIRIRTALRSADEDVLASLVKQDLLGCCELEIQQFQPEPEGAEMIAAKRQRELYISARCRYDTRTSAGGSNLAWNLQKALCLAIAKSHGGLLENPQLSQFRLVSAAS